MARSRKTHLQSTPFTPSHETSESQHVAFLGESSAKRKAEVHRKGESRPTGRVNPANVISLLEWQRFRCALTGRPLTPDAASLDHVIPVRAGGKHVIENTQVLHRDVNKAKSTMSNEDFIKMCCDVAAYADRLQKSKGASHENRTSAARVAETVSQQSAPE